MATRDTFCAAATFIIQRLQIILTFLHHRHHKNPGRVTRAAMKAQPQNARSRYLTTISTMEKESLADLECDNSTTETKWLWLLNAGDMAARARSRITEAENLPGAPVKVVELLAKVSRERRDGRLTTKKWKSRML